MRPATVETRQYGEKALNACYRDIACHLADDIRTRMEDLLQVRNEIRDIVRSECTRIRIMVESCLSLAPLLPKGIGMMAAPLPVVIGTVCMGAASRKYAEHKERYAEIDRHRALNAAIVLLEEWAEDYPEEAVCGAAEAGVFFEPGRDPLRVNRVRLYADHGLLLQW